ncbi:MAG: hypothetical protein IJS90_00750 [Clostridia bacterium]|nr:hypothetical protein [Clostridia bacterium]
MLGIGFENKSVYVFTDEGGLYYYSLTDDRTERGENVELIENSDFVYFWELDENFALGNAVVGDEYHPVVFSFKKGKVVYKDAVFSRLFGGYCLIGTKTFTALLNADGNEVMRIPLGGLA